MLLCFLITCSAMDVWDEKAIQNIKKEKKKKKRPDQTQTGWKIYCECSFFFLSVLFFFLFYQNEGKWFVSQNSFKNISGSVEKMQ